MTPVLAPSTAPWARRREDAVLTGSCAALSRALGLPVRAVRVLFLLGAALTLLSVPMLVAGSGFLGLGAPVLVLGAPLVLGYLCLWWALPLDREVERRTALAETAAALRGRPALERSAGLPSRQFTRWFVLAGVIGLAMVVVAATTILPIGAILTEDGAWPDPATSDYRSLVVVAIGVLAAGIALGVLPLDAVDRARWHGRVRSMPRLVLAAIGTGLALLALGAMWFVGLVFGTTAALTVLVVGLSLTALFAIVLVPWGRHLWLGMREETEQRALVQQRSEFTAHLHDSVLQTLTLLQRPGTDPESVRRLARRQERELRRWLYHDGAVDPDQPRDVRSAVTALCEDIEDQQGVDVHLVVIGDAPVVEAMRPLLRALRESTVNACRHGKVGVDVFVDVSAHRLEAFVRDRGPGFDLAEVPPDRLGVRESIIGRMQRAGGTARVHRAPGGGTEVALSLEVP